MFNHSIIELGYYSDQIQFIYLFALCEQKSCARSLPSIWIFYCRDPVTVLSAALSFFPHFPDHTLQIIHHSHYSWTSICLGSSQRGSLNWLGELWFSNLRKCWLWITPVTLHWVHQTRKWAIDRSHVLVQGINIQI